MKTWDDSKGEIILGESVKCLGDRSMGRGRHQATAGLVFFARGPKPRSLTSYPVPHVSLALATWIAPAEAARG